MNEYVMSFPTEVKPGSIADVHERIVRCKDCKYHFIEDEATSMRYGDDMCGYWVSDHGTHTDGFCAWGERREDA